MSNTFDFDNTDEPLKIPGIVGQQARYAISQHCGDDIGVMDLFAADLMVLHQSDQLPSNGDGIVRHFKLVDKLLNLCQYGGLRQLSEGLRSGECGQVFTDDLTTNPHCPARLTGIIDCGQCSLMGGASMTLA